MVKKVSISLDEQSLSQLDYIRNQLHFNPKMKLSTLIQQVIFEQYCRLQNSRHGFPDCTEDCRHCRDEPVCEYSRLIDNTYIT